MSTVVRTEHDEEPVERWPAERGEHAGRKSACFGGEVPYRDEAPAARTTAWTLIPTLT